MLVGVWACVRVCAWEGERERERERGVGKACACGWFWRVLTLPSIFPLSSLHPSPPTPHPRPPGNGQTVSLIVSLGRFSGGELGVEGSVHDVRYRPLEFDGWAQRHWTLPFSGERYSLVWFTPLGVAQEDLWWWHAEGK